MPFYVSVVATGTLKKEHLAIPAYTYVHSCSTLATSSIVHSPPSNIVPIDLNLTFARVQ